MNKEDHTSSKLDQKESGLRDPEVAKRSLVELQDLLSRFRLESQLTNSANSRVDQERKPVLQELVINKQLQALTHKLEHLHVADIAYILEALPLFERELVWKQVSLPNQSQVLIEINDPVRLSLISWMNEDELTFIAQSLDPDDLATIADHIPKGIIEKVRDELSLSEKEQLFVNHYYPFYVQRHNFAPKGSEHKSKREQCALGLLYQNGEHRYLWPIREFIETCKDIGFINVREMPYNESLMSAFNNIETPCKIREAHSAIVEAVRP